MENKKGFNLFAHKKQELPNQANNIENNNIEQHNAVDQTPIIETQNQDFGQNIFDEQIIKETQNVEQNIFNEPIPAPQMPATDFISNNLDQPLQQVENNTFGTDNQSEFSTQETEQSIENQLASEVESPQPVPQPEVPATPTVTEQTQPTQPELPPEPQNINALNNLSTYDGNIKEKAKIELNKKPFIIIAGIAALLLCAGFMFGGSNKTFGKAPNEIIVPGENEEDLSNKVEAPDNEENEPSNDEEDKNINLAPEETPSTPNNNGNKENSSSIGSLSTTSKTIENIILNDENLTLAYNFAFGTQQRNPSVYYPLGESYYYDVNQVGRELTISLEGNVVSYLNFSQIDILNQDEHEVYMKGYLSNRHLLVKAYKTPGTGYYYILDGQFQIVDSGNYEKDYEPQTTEEAIYYGKVNCNGTRSNKEKGPVVDIYKLDTFSRKTEHVYSIDYTGNFNTCS